MDVHSFIVLFKFIEMYVLINCDVKDSESRIINIIYDYKWEQLC